MKKFLIASVVALTVVLVGAASVNAAYTRNLTIGSTGTDVAELQSYLIGKGYSIPAISSGIAAPGYFGSQTKTAVMAYQAAKGIPNTGFFGPLTMASVNANDGVTGNTPVQTAMVVPFPCPAGFVPPAPWVCPGTPGATVTPTPGSTGVITTPGVEGTLSATQSNAGILSTIYENDRQASVLGVKLEAKTSDISVQRVKIDLGTDSRIYNKIFSKVYITEGSNVLASADLNSSTVVKDGSNYYITVTGMNLVVPRNSSRTVMVAFDVKPTIDSTDIDDDSYPVAIAASGFRGIDGAGIDQYAGSTSITRTPNISSDLADNATLNLSLNTSSPKKSDVVATLGSSENELDKLPLLVFDVKAEKDAVKITDIRIGVVKSGSGSAVASTAYLFDGSTELDNASVVGGMATFNDFDYTIARDTTKTFTVKVDIASANATEARFYAIASTTIAADLAAENSRGDSVVESGSATGQTIGVRNVGAEIALVSKSIVTNGAPQTSGASNIATSSLTATFVLRVKAVGGPLGFGTAASSTPMFTATPSTFKVYKNSVVYSDISSYATSTDFTAPSGLTTASETFTLPEGQTVEIPVSFKIVGRSALGPLTDGIYSVSLEGVQPNAAYAATFMAGEADWRTTGVSFP
jgi:peptidoglycan hydrolase-like protein with peptidoglycan-binding domain